jgi:hypothetical protein
VLVLKILDHLSLILVERDLVLEHELPIGLLLHGPQPLLLLLGGLLVSAVAHLLLALRLDLLDLVRPQSLEVVGHVAVPAVVRGRRSARLLHEVGRVRVVHLLLVLRLLRVVEVRLLVPLGLGLLMSVMHLQGACSPPASPSSCYSFFATHHLPACLASGSEPQSGLRTPFPRHPPQPFVGHSPFFAAQPKSFRSQHSKPCDHYTL